MPAQLAQYLLFQGSILAWSFVTFTACELVNARNPVSWRSRIWGALIWTIYLPFSGLTIIAFGDLRNALGIHPLWVLTLSPDPHWPWWLLWPALAAVAFISVMFGDFFFYWAHRAQHSRWLWPFHAVHHSQTDLNAVSCFHHWTEELIRIPFMAAPMALLASVDAPRGEIIGFIIAAQVYWIHSPLKVHAGPLRRVFNDPRFHRIHHSTDPRHFGTNFGGFSTVWDQLFGTAYFPAEHEWPATGLADLKPPRTIGEYLFGPFGRLRHIAN